MSDIDISFVLYVAYQAEEESMHQLLRRNVN
jgi:hypothetical protein